MQWPASYWGVIPGYVAIYHSDGTVAVTHGGIECGQGINTKVAQVAAFALGVPLDSISVKPMDNVSSANAALTGSSVTSEMACYVSIICLLICVSVFMYFYLRSFRRSRRPANY